MPDSDPRTSESLALLLRALVSLDDPTAALALLQDLCTPRELEDLSQRLEVACMLDAGVSYACIQAATGASATTVARVARCLGHGKSAAIAACSMCCSLWGGGPCGVRWPSPHVVARNGSTKYQL